MAYKKIALVTGASRGIGRDLAGFLIELGYFVVGCSRTSFDLGHPDYSHAVLDVSDETEVLSLFRNLSKSHGRLDALINSAGIASMNHSLLTPGTTAQRIFDINVIGTFLMCREGAKLMRHDGGRIVNFISIASPLRLEGEAVYASSKAAVLNLTQILAREFAPLNVTINAIGPTPIKTDLIKAVPMDKLERLIRRQAIKRFGEFSDVRNAVEFFLRPGSEFITGQHLYLGGIS